MLASSSRHALKAGQHGLAAAAAPRSLLAAAQASSSQRRNVAAQTARSVTSGSSFQPFASSRGSKPFNYKANPNFKVEKSRGSDLARANMELGRLVEDKRHADAFTLCREMKNRGLRPNRATYEHLMTACKDMAYIPEAWAVLEDMIACGIAPDRTTFHDLILTVRFEHYNTVEKVWNLMLAHNIKPNEASYEILISYLSRNRHLEMSLQKIGEMSKYGLSPSIRTVQRVISLACDNGHPRLAVELANAFESSSVRRLDAETWMKCLIASSEMLYADGVLTAWQQTVKKMQIYPDEGCCINVLHTAGRHGLTSLALEVIQALQTMKVTLEEQHFAPVIEAMCRDGDIQEGFGVLELMRAHDVSPSLETAYPIFEVISESADAVDEAYGILDNMKQAGKTIDTSAFNVVIQACVALADLQRALGTYKAAAELGVTPNVETYNLLLSACIKANHRELGDRLLNEMRAAGIQPDTRTYERLIVLCLTQPNYEHAFYYLEEMKTRSLRPTQAIYEAIIRKCFSVGDSRHQLALEEMVEQGYEQSGKLKAFLESGGKTGTFERKTKSFAPKGAETSSAPASS